MQLNAYMCPVDAIRSKVLIHLVWYGPLLSGVQGARGRLNKSPKEKEVVKQHWLILK